MYIFTIFVLPAMCFPAHNHAGIAMDRCRRAYNPEGGDEWSMDAGTSYEPGKYYNLKPKLKACHIFSLDAVVSPAQGN